MAQTRYEMSDEQWIKIKDLFPVAKTGPGLNHELTNCKQTKKVSG